MSSKPLAIRAKEYGEQFKGEPVSSEISRTCAWLVGYLQARGDMRDAAMKAVHKSKLCGECADELEAILLKMRE